MRRSCLLLAHSSARWHLQNPQSQSLLLALGATKHVQAFTIVSRQALGCCRSVPRAMKEFVVEKRRNEGRISIALAIASRFASRAKKTFLPADLIHLFLSPLSLSLSKKKKKRKPSGASRRPTSGSGRWRDRRIPTATLAAAALALERARAGSSAQSSAVAAEEGVRASKQTEFFPLLAPVSFDRH